jgi:hypothetical protein
MTITPHKHIEAFYKAFSIFRNMTVYENEIVYTHQRYRIEESAKQAKDIIFKNQLSLEVHYDTRYHSITIKLISELDRLDNSFGTASERLTELQKQL